jgi:transcriptional repressor NrdR
MQTIHPQKTIETLPNDRLPSSRVKALEFAPFSRLCATMPLLQVVARGARALMKCPFCREGDFAVVDSRNQEGNFPIRRRRVCDHCKRKVWTIERIEEVPLQVIKKHDGRREPFDPDKLRRGLEKACYKRPITADQLDSMVRQIENEIHACYYAEVPAPVIGDLAMEHLQRLDQVAYVRFASVYRRFEDLDAFMDVVKSLIQPATGKSIAARTADDPTVEGHAAPAPLPEKS